MGQGAESCGGYEVEYEPYFDDENIGMGIWIQKCGTKIPVSKMTSSHIRNSIRLCEAARDRSNFSCDSDSWEDWIDIFKSELYSRGESLFRVAKYTSPSAKKQARGSKLNLRCHCGNDYQARIADLKRGWAKSCCKRCAAIKRDFGRKDPVCAETGVKLSKLLERVGK